MKRKQCSLDAFLNTPRESAPSAHQRSDGSKRRTHTVVDLTDTDTDPTPCTAENNAFHRLLAASKSAAHRHRAVFSLTLDESGRFLPDFSFGSSACPNEGWSCETKVSKFRWDVFNREYRDLSLTLWTNISPEQQQREGERGSVAMETERETERRTPSSPMAGSLVKSMMQKGTRRRMARKAIKLAQHLCTQDLQDALRRLPVISVEDSVLHPALPVLVWLMIASTKGFQPPRACVSKLCAALMGDLAQCEFKDCYPTVCTSYILPASATFSPSPATNTTENISSTPASSSSISSPSPSSSSSSSVSENTILSLLPNAASRTLVASLLLRRGYGGMHCDMDMLEEYAVLWARRLQGELSSAGERDAHTSPSLQSLVLSERYTAQLRRCGSLHHTPEFLSWGSQLEQAFCKYDSSMIECIASLNKPRIDMESTLDRLLCVWLRDDRSTSLSLLTQSLLDLRLTADDLISEGIDFHCDFAIIDALLEKCTATLRSVLQNDTEPQQTVGKERLIDLIKKSIWLFRSSLNVHRLWAVSNAEKAQFDLLLAQQLREKQELSPVWKVICREINIYCTAKLQTIKSRLHTQKLLTIQSSIETKAEET